VATEHIERKIDEKTGSPYPGFVNFKLQGDEIIVTVRAPTKHGLAPGEQATILLPIDDFRKATVEFLKDVKANG
jgi:hypothetical protein